MGKGTLTHCKWERMLVAPLQETIWQYLMLKPYDSTIPSLDIHIRESLAHVLKEASKRILVSSTICEKWKQPIVSCGRMNT